MLGLNARFDALDKELFQAFMLEARNHELNVTYTVTSYKPPNILYGIFPYNHPIWGVMRKFL